MLINKVYSKSLILKNSTKANVKFNIQL